MPSAAPLSRLSTEVRRRISDWITRAWHAHPCPALLRPLAACTTALYLAGLRRDQKRMLLQRQKLPATIISIGNLVTGGTGKTPVTIWLARYLSEIAGRRVAILSRGYGRRSGETLRVPASGDSREQVTHFGDEPILMARSVPHVPVWVGRKRFLSGPAAIESCGTDTLLLDDGFQHLSLHRDLDIVLLDTTSPLGNGLLLPLGPLREPVENLSRADIFILTRADDEERLLQLRSRLSKQFPEKPVFACTHRLTHFKLGLDGRRIPVEALRGRPVVAFAGIAHPERFFHSLEKLGLRLSSMYPFPDHHPYRAGDLVHLLESARPSRAQLLVTTEKDMVRLPADMQPFVLGAGLEVDFGADQQPFRSCICGMLGKGK